MRPRSALAKAAVLRTVSFLPTPLCALCAEVWGAGLAGGARGACAPVRHSQKRLAPMALLDLFSYACARASTAWGWDVCPVEHAGRAPPFGTRKSSRAAHCLFFICAHSSTLYAPRYGARISPVEHAGRAPPFGTRKNALRRWRCSVFFLMPALVQARRGHKKNARTPSE